MSWPLPCATMRSARGERVASSHRKCITIVKHCSGLSDGPGDELPSGSVISQARFEDNNGAGLAKHFDMKILAADNQNLVVAAGHCWRQESENNHQRSKINATTDG
jgi:hypothetical protein